MYIICLPIGTGRVVSVSVLFLINLWFYENIVSVSYGIILGYISGVVE